MYEFLIAVDAGTNIEKYTYLTNYLHWPLTTSTSLSVAFKVVLSRLQYLIDHKKYGLQKIEHIKVF